MQMMQMITMGRMVAHAVGVAARLDLATMLGTSTLAADELARRTETHADALYRLMRALASVGVFVEEEAGKFRNSPLSDTLRSDVPVSSRPLALFFCSEPHVKVWLGLDHSVRTGMTAFEKMLGAPAFEYVAKDPAFGEVFNNAMTAFSAAMGPAIADAYDFTGLETLVDVGGGHGQLLCSILAVNASMRAVLFDLPHVVAGAPAVIEPLGLASRIEVVGGDFFKSVPAAGAYIMKAILHDWSDAEAIRILQTIHRAARPNARVLLAEAILQPGNEPDIAKFMDLEMLLAAGGRERNAAQWADLLRAGGFRLERVLPTASPLCVLEAVRA